MKKNPTLLPYLIIAGSVFVFATVAFFGICFLVLGFGVLTLNYSVGFPVEIPPLVPIHLPATLEEVKSTCSQGECLQACIAHVDHEFKGEHFSTPSYSGDDVTLVYYGIKNDELVKPRIPKVPADLVPLQENVNAHQNIWDYFRTIIPPESRPNLVQFVIYASTTSDGKFDDTLYDNWLMYYNILAQQNADIMSDILIHEYGHYLTLNRKQMDWESNVCHTEAIYGCEKADAYLNLFYLEFWKDIYPEWKEIKYESKNYESDIELFYEKYQSRFVNQYASTDPVEDIAESWTAFVIKPTPLGNSIAEQKIKFFYQFPELVQLRYQIIKGICTYKRTS